MTDNPTDTSPEAVARMKAALNVLEEALIESNFDMRLPDSAAQPSSAICLIEALAAERDKKDASWRRELASAEKAERQRDTAEARVRELEDENNGITVSYQQLINEAEAERQKLFYIIAGLLTFADAKNDAEYKKTIEARAALNTGGKL